MMLDKFMSLSFRFMSDTFLFGSGQRVTVMSMSFEGKSEWIRKLRIKTYFPT
jgi:hypothetical protein